MNDTHDFSTFTRAALIQYALDAANRADYAEGEVEFLKASLKDAIQAYRELIINHDKEKQNVSN